MNKDKEKEGWFTEREIAMSFVAVLVYEATGDTKIAREAAYEHYKNVYGGKLKIVSYKKKYGSEPLVTNY